MGWIKGHSANISVKSTERQAGHDGKTVVIDWF